MWTLSGKTYSSRLILGSHAYSTPEVLSETLAAAGTELVSVPIRHGSAKPSELSAMQNLIEEMGLNLLPATADCRNAKDAVTTAYQARDLLGFPWIQLEIIGDEASCLPDSMATVEAAGKLLKQGFDVLPVTTGDVVAASRLVELGCAALILRDRATGANRGLAQLFSLLPLRARFPKTTLIVDAGITRPSEAALALELGFDGALVGDAVALARDPISMAEAFADAVTAGRMGYDAGLSDQQPEVGNDPVLGTPFWHTLPER